MNAMVNKIKQYQIFTKNNVKIGVFGIGVELEGLVDKKLYKDTRYLNPIPIAHKIAKVLKTIEKCDLAICLSHLGYKYKSEKSSDIKLAEKSENIDLIIGGHTHTFLEKPTKIRNLSGIITLIVQVGWAGINLGRLDFYINKEKNYSVNYQNIRINKKTF